MDEPKQEPEQQPAMQIDDLKANPKNPRLIDKPEFEALKKSIREFGDLSAVVYNIKTGQLVGGHQRVEAFKASGGEKKIVYSHRHYNEPDRVGTVASGYVMVDGLKFPYREVNWELAREEAANIAANRIQGRFDIDLLAQVNYELSQLEGGAELLALTGQTKSEIDKLLDMVGANGDGNPEDDETPPIDTAHPAASQLGEIYQLGRHRLMCGDATSLDDVQALLNGAEADLVFTDPPYNVAYEGKTEDALTIQNDNFKDSAAFYDFLFLAFSNLAAITKKGSSIYVCHADSEGYNFRRAFLEAGYDLKQCIIWNKNQMVMGRQDYQWKHEPILYGWKPGASHYFVGDRNLTTVWEFDKPSASIEHPTMKPVAMISFALKNSSKRGDLVVDTFGGSGSTLIAADKLDRVCNIMELDPRYCDVIRKRYHKHTTGQDDGWAEATPALAVPAEEVAAADA